MAAEDQDHLDLDLDTFEFEKPAEQFSFKHADRLITLKDPRDLDVFELAELRADDPYGFFQKCMSAEDLAFIVDHPISGRKFQLLLERFAKKTGVLAPGKPGASRTF